MVTAGMEMLSTGFWETQCPTMHQCETGSSFWLRACAGRPGEHQLVVAPPARFSGIGVVGHERVAVGHEVRQYVL
jgi:hypothetical protein